LLLFVFGLLQVKLGSWLSGFVLLPVIDPNRKTRDCIRKNNFIPVSEDNQYQSFLHVNFGPEIQNFILDKIFFARYNLIRSHLMQFGESITSAEVQDENREGAGRYPLSFFLPI